MSMKMQCKCNAIVFEEGVCMQHHCQMVGFRCVCLSMCVWRFSMSAVSCANTNLRLLDPTVKSFSVSPSAQHNIDRSNCLDKGYYGSHRMNRIRPSRSFFSCSGYVPSARPPSVPFLISYISRIGRIGRIGSIGNPQPAMD